MGLTAILAVNAALVRVFVVREMLRGGILIFIALQVGFWCLLRSLGRLRCFWSGFEVSGMAAVLILFPGEFFPGSLLDRLVDIADELAVTHLPTPLSDYLGEHWDLFLAVVYFVPVLVAALLGGMLAAWLIPRGLTPARTMNREESAALIG
jgi:hypothetical protein